MRKLLLVLGMAVATSLVWGQDAQQDSQEGPPLGERMHHMGQPSPAEHVKRLTKELGLNAKQSAKIKQIFEDQQKKHESEMQNAESLSPEERHANFLATRKQVDSQIEALLTDAQKAKFKQMQARMQEHRGHEGHPPDGQQGTSPDQQQ